MPPWRKPPIRSRPTAAASSTARRASASSRPTSTISCSASAIHASLEPNPARSMVLHTAPGTWASSNCRSVRTSTTRAPSARFCSTCRGASGWPSTPSRSSGPRLISTIRWKLGGWGPRSSIRRAAKRSPSSSASIALLARSKPIVDEAFMSIPDPPHSDPPRCPGQTSTSAGSSSSRSRREAKMSAAPSSTSTARSGRATPPTNSVSPVSTAHGSWERAVSVRENAVCSGRWPGVWTARTLTRPRSSSQPSSKGSWGYSAAARRWMWIEAPVAAASRPWPDT